MPDGTIVFQIKCNILNTYDELYNIFFTGLLPCHLCCLLLKSTSDLCNVTPIERTFGMTVDLDSCPPRFWQALVLRLLRVAVQVAAKADRANTSALHDLLDVAIYQELRSQGLSNNKMSLVLGCSTRLITKIAAKARTLDAESLQVGALKRVLDRLQQGPTSAEEIERLLPFVPEFDVFTLLVQLLESRRVITQRGSPPAYYLTPSWNDGDPARWQKVLEESEHIVCTALIILDELLLEPATTSQLGRSGALRDTSVDLVEAALALLSTSGMATVKTVGAHRSKQYALADGYHRLIPSDRDARFRVGLLDFVRKLSMFLDSVLHTHGAEFFGQRNLIFRISSADLARFTAEHGQQVTRKLQELEANSDGDPHARAAVFGWFLSFLRSDPPPSNRD